MKLFSIFHAFFRLFVHFVKSDHSFSPGKSTRFKGTCLSCGYNLFKVPANKINRFFEIDKDSYEKWKNSHKISTTIKLDRDIIERMRKNIDPDT